jgi:hypothetical protein
MATDYPFGILNFSYGGCMYYIHHHKTGRHKAKEDIQVMSYGRNTYTTIRLDDIKIMAYGRNTYI